MTRPQTGVDPGAIESVYGNTAHTVPITDRRRSRYSHGLTTAGPSSARSKAESQGREWLASGAKRSRRSPTLRFIVQYLKTDRCESGALSDGQIWSRDASTPFDLTSFDNWWQACADSEELNARLPRRIDVAEFVRTPDACVTNGPQQRTTVNIEPRALSSRPRTNEPLHLNRTWPELRRSNTSDVTPAPGFAF